MWASSAAFVAWPGHGVRRRPGRRAAHLEQHQHVGHPVLERLEGADRAAELHPLLAVGDRHVQRPGGQAGLQRGHADGADQLGAAPRRGGAVADRGGRRVASGRRGRAGSSGPWTRPRSGVARCRGRPRPAVVASPRAGPWRGRRPAPGRRPRRTRRPRRRRSGGAAGAWRPRRPPASSASAVTSEDSSGDGASERPSSSSTISDSKRVNPAPSYSSGMASAATPICSQSVAQSASSYSDRRDAAGSARLASSDRTVAASSCCSSVNANSISRPVPPGPARGGTPGCPRPSPGRGPW